MAKAVNRICLDPRSRCKRHFQLSHEPWKQGTSIMCSTRFSPFLFDMALGCFAALRGNSGLHWLGLSSCIACTTGASFPGQQGGLQRVPDRSHRVPHHPLRLLHFPGQRPPAQNSLSPSADASRRAPQHANLEMGHCRPKYINKQKPDSVCTPWLMCVTHALVC